MSRPETNLRGRQRGLSKIILFALLGVAVMTAAAGAVLIAVQGTGSFDSTAKIPQQIDTVSGGNPSGSSAPSPGQEKADPNARSPGKSSP